MKTKITFFSNALIQWKNIHVKAVPLITNRKSHCLLLQGIFIQITNILSSALHDSGTYEGFFFN